MNASLRKIGIVGAGSWGTALAMLLERNGCEVTAWGHDAAAIQRLEEHRENRAYLPGVSISKNIRLTDSLESLTDAELLLLVTPSGAIREVASRLSTVGLHKDVALLSCTKGVERGSGLRMSQILEETLPGHPLAVLSGPSHAEEVARQAPTAVVLGCANPDLLGRLQSVFSNNTFRAYTSSDITGIELGGALKNVFALAAGVSDGLQLGDNTKAALVTRSLTEMIRLGSALGGRPETFQGLSGIGDLMVTCFSKHSRNRSVGERLGKGEPLAQIVSSMSMIAEGVPTTYSAHECARKLGVDTPIIDHVRLILEGTLSPSEAMAALLSRDPRPE